MVRCVILKTTNLLYCFVLFLIFCNKLWAAEQITINWSGIDGKLLSNAKQYVRLSQEAPDKLTQERIKYLFEVANEGIKWSLRPFGYYNASVNSKLLEPSEKNSSWQADFNIQLNEPVKIQAVNIDLIGEAKDDKKFQEFISSFPSKEGDILNHPVYEKGKRDLEELALERGYLDAELLQHKIKIYKKSNQAQINLQLNSGPRYCIESVQFNQNQFKPAVLSRFVPFEKGAPYSRERLSKLRHALMDSGYFKQIDIQKIKLGDPNKHCIYLKISPELRERDTYRGRIGYGTDTGVRVGIDAKYSYLNRFGHSLSGSLGYTVKKKRHLAKANYIIPVGQNKDTFWKFSLGYKAEDYTSSDAVSGIKGVDGLTRVKDLSLSIGWHQPRILFNSIKLKEFFSIEYLSEGYDLFPLLFNPEDQDLLKKAVIDPDFAYLFPKEGLAVLTPDFNVFSLAFNWSYQNADNRIYANRGYRIDWGVKGTSKSLGSDISYWQTRIKTKYIHRLNNSSRLLFRSDMAYTDAEVISFFEFPINQLPKELLFATGGDNSIRGYEFEELDGGDTLPRAKHLLVGSLEYEREIYPQWSLAAFYDVGNAFNKYADFDAKTGIGLGVRWHSPIGMVRLDIAHAKDRDGAPFRLHLTIGPDF